MDLLGKLLGIVGGILGALAFGWRLLDARQSYVYIDLTVDKPLDGYAMVKATVENKSWYWKRIKYAFLLIGPETEEPIETFNNIAGVNNLQPVAVTNDLGERRVSHVLKGDEGRILLPLPFFFRENVAIADEKISYSTPLTKGWFTATLPYAIRFYVFPSDGLHRSTQGAVVLPKA